MPEQTLSIFLIKQGFAEPPLRSASLPVYAVEDNDIPVGNLYIKAAIDKQAGWVSFFSGAISHISERVVSAHASAVLFIERKGRTFALTFGHGRSLLEPGSWEEDFGLKVTLNSVDPNKIRSIDRMSLDLIGQHSQIQASLESNIREFGLDTEQDLLRTVTAAPANEALGKRLTGKDDLKIKLDLRPSELPALLDLVMQQWQSTDYQAHFPWIDQIKELKDRIRIDSLDQQLISQIKTEDFTGLWLAIPQRLEWSQIEGFRYRTAQSATLYSDVHIKTLLEEYGDVDSLSIEKLKRRHIYAISQDAEHVYDEWSAYRCIYFESTIGEETFLLTNGKWYRIGTAFLERVDAAYRELAKNTFMLPDFDDKSEGAYNLRVATEFPNDFVSFDKENIYFPDDLSKVEFCDLYEKSKKLIHVKRYAGASAPLSHLFAQAVVSGALFRRESGFRLKVNDKIPDPFKPVTDQPRASEYEVVFGIVSDSTKELVLPFFSRINIKNATDRLAEMGYKVSLTKIQAPKKSKASAKKMAVVKSKLTISN